MNDPNVSVRAVWAALDSLRDLILVPYFGVGGVVQSPDPFAVRGAWKDLEAALSDAKGTIQNPAPGQGVASIWLRSICNKAVQVCERAKNLPSGLQDVVWLDDVKLDWLMTNGWQTGISVMRRQRRQAHGIADLLKKQFSPMHELCALGREWHADLDSSYDQLRKVGELLVEAVDALEVENGWFDEESFSDAVLTNLEFPSAVASKQLKEQTGDGLLALVHALEHPPGTDPIDERREPYANYSRDRWIYENVELHDCQTLSKLCELECNAKNWKFIGSRNGLKVAADRYADCSQLPRRRFPDKRRKKQS